jgi:hypothetical protein
MTTAFEAVITGRKGNKKARKPGFPLTSQRLSQNKKHSLQINREAFSNSTLEPRNGQNKEEKTILVVTECLPNA